VRYLADLIALFKNDLRLVLAAYNAGEGAMVQYGYPR
jgi:soluble lytic murein transglycosylase-like protein